MSQYLNNKETFIDICFWKVKIYSFKDRSIKPPDEIGEAIRKTTEGLSRHSKFNNYTWKEDMIANGIESMIKGLHNFNEQKYSNPHGYMSKSAEYAFLQTIEKEDRELLSVYSSFLTKHRDDLHTGDLIRSTEDELFVQSMVDKVKNIEESIDRKKKRRKLLKMKRELSPMALMIYGDDIVDRIDERIKKTETFYTSNKITYGERGRLLILVEDIKKDLNIEIGSLCVGDVVDYLYKFRDMDIDEESMKFHNHSIEIEMVEYDGREFVDIRWGYND